MIKLTVVPCAGLANRINCIMSAWELLEHYEAEIDIYWENTPDCAADFNDLFMPISRNHLTMHNTTPFHLKAPSKRNLFVPTLIRHALFNHQYSGSEFDRLDLDDVMKKDISIYISAHNRFNKYARISMMGEILVPAHDIQYRINKVVSQYADYTVGVHIRRTDNVLAIQNNPIEKYIDLMNQEIEKHPDSKFYVATDSIDVKNELRRKYGERVITEQWELRRNRKQGIKDAVAEVFCLGKCSKIIGSTNSTFSLLGSRLFDTPILF